MFTENLLTPFQVMYHSTPFPFEIPKLGPVNTDPSTQRTSPSYKRQFSSVLKLFSRTGTFWTPYITKCLKICVLGMGGGLLYNDLWPVDYPILGLVIIYLYKSYFIYSLFIYFIFFKSVKFKRQQNGKKTKTKWKGRGHKRGAKGIESTYHHQISLFLYSTDWVG